MVDGAKDASNTVRTPPYVAFKTFNTMIADLNEHGVPSVIDRSVLRRFSGGVGSQLITALRALNLINGDNKPTERLIELVAEYGSENYKAHVAGLLKVGYPYLDHLDLTTSTPSQFAEAFRVTGAKEDVLRKARTFFLHAAQFADVPIGSRLTSGSAPRSAAPRRRPAGLRAKPAQTGAPPSPAAGVATPQSTAEKGKALEYLLIDLLKEDGIGEPETEAIFTLVRYLAKKAASQ